MTDNLVSAVSRFLTPELIGKLASVSGLDRGTTQSAVGACVPAILSGLADLAAKPGGARQLADAITEQPAGMLSNLAQTLGTSAMSAEKGGGILSSLLGGGMLNTLVSTLSRFVGIGEGSTRTLMGLLTPVVLGVLGREQRAAGLETGGLARMLMGQRDQFTSAMPVGLSDLLSSRVRMQEGVETVRPESRTYSERSSEAPETQSYRATTSGVRRPVETREPETGWNWAYWVLPLLALGGLLWYLLPGSQTGTDRTATAPTSQFTPGTPSTSSTPGTTGTQGTTTTQQGTPGTGTAPATPGKVTYFSKASPDWVPIAMYYNQDIYNKAGEKIGSVKDLMIGPDGRIHAAVLSVGRFLGIGERDIAVPLSAIEIDRRPDGSRVTIDVVKDTLQTAPAFDLGTDRIRLRQ
jgi:sporulation protein YlmC with PRC-barrel domain